MKTKLSMSLVNLLSESFFLLDTILELVEIFVEFLKTENIPLH